jgi:hypothetical protein
MFPLHAHNMAFLMETIFELWLDEGLENKFFYFQKHLLQKTNNS